MDHRSRAGFFPCDPAEARVALILLKYAFLRGGAFRHPRRIVSRSLPIDQIPSQQGTDLRYIGIWLSRPDTFSIWIPAQRLVSARQIGTANRGGPVQPALSSDMDAYTNVESLHFKFDQEKTTSLCSTSTTRKPDHHTDSFTADHATKPATRVIPPLPTNLVPPDLSPFRDNLSEKRSPRQS